LQNVLGLLPDCKALHPRRHSTVIVTYERSWDPTCIKLASICKCGCTLLPPILWL
jgi:hypothetical protein